MKNDSEDHSPQIYDIPIVIWLVYAFTNHHRLATLGHEELFSEMPSSDFGFMIKFCIGKYVIDNDIF